MRIKRIVVYCKDVQNITGKGERASRTILNNIKKNLNKDPHQLVTVTELCDYLGLDPEEVQKMII